ncbi:uncharacterized protein LOC110859976 isoform X6 [Folsomia candida]|uniref:Uncharacterized protein n=2 Tax=Folsomia candida TaxID=158441 RepID=A0A226D9F6_FOLCA|nr:uncharacterized protein LOC110859976 isoform X6 [Folsomia candida]OXA41783.1 hypothetical protein Fcan01_23439 [Folsomia candida]
MAFPIHHVMQTEEEVGPLDAVDQAVLDRILELFSTPYPQLTRPQVLMLETIVAATKEAQVPFSHIFQPDDILYDDTMGIDDDVPLANIIIPRSVQLYSLAPFIRTIKGQQPIGHTITDSVADQMRDLWNTYSRARGDEDGQNHTQEDVLEFVNFLELLTGDPLGLPLISLRGAECHVLYDHEANCFRQIYNKGRFMLCRSPACFRSEKEVISVHFSNCSRHYATDMHVVLEITRVEEDDDGEEKIGNHPYRYVQFQVSANLEWNNARMMKYLQNVWRQHKASYTPNVASVVTEAWIFTEYQAAVEKIACLQFCHLIFALNDSNYEFVSDHIVLPVNLHDQLSTLLNSMGVTISLEGIVSDEDLQSIGLSDLFGVPFNEESLQESKIVLYRESNMHFEYRGLTMDWGKKRFYEKHVHKTLLFACKERGHRFNFEPRRILFDRDDMEKAEFFTILGSVIVGYLHAPRPDNRQDFVNVNCRLDTRFLSNRRPNSDTFKAPLEEYEHGGNRDDDFNYEDEGAIYDNQHLTDLELLLQWIANEYRCRVIITVKPEEVDQ